MQTDRYIQVKKAINMGGPDYVPLLFFNKNREKSDIIIIDVARHFMGPDRDTSEWGFRWRRCDETMGQPVKEIITEWRDFESLKIPDAYDKTRFDGVESVMSEYAGRYYLASLVLSGFTIMTFLRGFTNTLEDLYEEPEKLGRLADVVFGFEEDVIRRLKDFGFNGVAFYDDWGTQSNLIISPEMWRKFFKPRYKKQFDLAHEYCLDVYFHCCGHIYEIIPDLIEIGADMLNLSQPNLFDIEKLGKDFGGGVCFVCPVSYQTTSISGTKEDIFREVRRLVENLGCFNGGLIGYLEEYHSIGMSSENYENCVNAFTELGSYN